MDSFATHNDSVSSTSDLMESKRPPKGVCGLLRRGRKMKLVRFTKSQTAGGAPPTRLPQYFSTFATVMHSGSRRSPGGCFSGRTPRTRVKHSKNTSKQQQQRRRRRLVGITNVFRRPYKILIWWDSLKLAQTYAQFI